jgi:hypothetical protein
MNILPFSYIDGSGYLPIAAERRSHPRLMIPSKNQSTIGGGSRDLELPEDSEIVQNQP